MSLGCQPGQNLMREQKPVTRILLCGQNITERISICNGTKLSAGCLYRKRDVLMHHHATCSSSKAAGQKATESSCYVCSHCAYLLCIRACALFKLQQQVLQFPFPWRPQQRHTDHCGENHHKPFASTCPLGHSFEPHMHFLFWQAGQSRTEGGTSFLALGRRSSAWG